MTQEADRPVERPRVTDGPPSGYFVVVDSRGDADEVISLSQFFTVLRRSWKQVAIFIVVAASIAAAIALIMKPVFRAETLLAPVEAQGAAARGALRGQLGGLAALAGLDAGGGVTARDEAIATLESKGFAREFIEAQGMLPLLFPEKWDSQAKNWRDGKPATIDSAVKRFTENVRFVVEDRKTGLVTLAIETYSPELASRWANGMVKHVNVRMRDTARNQAEKSIQYLKDELAKSNVLPLQVAINRLIEEQVNNAMFANVQYDYAFRVIDPAVPPALRSRPKRTMMVLVGGVVGGFLGMLWVLIRVQRRHDGSGSKVVDR